SLVQIEPYTVALPVTSVSLDVLTIVLPRTMIRPLKSRVPWIVRSPSTIRMPAPLALPLPLMVVPPVPGKYVICGAAVVPKVALPLMLLLLLVTTPGRLRRSVAIWFTCATVGAAGDVVTLGVIGGPIENPSPVTLSFWPPLR